MKRYLTFILLVLATSISVLHAQTDEKSMLDLLQDSVPETEYVTNAFKSTRVINGQSIEMIGTGSLDFRILHRFGPITNGAAGLWGLDQSTMRFSFDYAPIHDLLVGFGRSTAKREYDAYAKYRIVQQSRGATTMPVSLVAVAGITCETLPWEDQTRPNYFTSRLGFFQQILIGSKLNDDLSLQLSPTLVHRNLVATTSDPNNVYALGFGGRIKLTNRISFTVDFYHAFNGMISGLNYDALSVGFDIETGGHVFQVHITNTNGMNERAFITETYNSWGKGQIQLGFNISRMFQL